MKQESSILSNAVYRWSGEIFNKGLWLVFIILLARNLGSDEFGFFNYVFSFSSILVVLTDLGTNIVLLKNLSRTDDKTTRILNNVLFIKTVLSIIIFIAIMIYANIIGKQSFILILISLSLLISAFLDPLNSVYRAHSKMSYETVVMLLWRILIVGISFIGLYWLNFRLLWISISFVLAGIISVTASFKIAKTSFHIEKISFSRINIDECLNIIKQSLPVGLIIFISTVFYKLNVVLLEHLSTSDEVGWYSASFKLIEAGFFIPTIFVGSIFPYLCRENKNNRITQYGLSMFKKAFLLLFAIALVMALFVSLFSSNIISLVYGSRYLPALKTLYIVAWMPVFIYLNELFIILLLSIDKHKTIIHLSIAPMSIYLLLCFILIPVLKSEGAAWALLIAEAVLLGSNILFLRYSKSSRI
jgi:O-antigen/teichoic acid export membrane protein